MKIVKMFAGGKSSVAKKMKWFHIITTALVTFALAVFVFNMTNLFSFSHDERKDSLIMTERIEKLCSLATVRYSYQEILNYADVLNFGGTTLPFNLGTKKILIIYQAYANGGCNLIRSEKVNDQSIKVYLSKGEILDNVLVLDSVEIYDVQEGIFNKFNPGDDITLINQDMKAYADENKAEIIRAAEKNAAEIVAGFLEGLGYVNTEVVFQ